MASAQKKGAAGLTTNAGLIPSLKRAGAEGIIEYPLNKVIY